MSNPVEKLLAQPDSLLAAFRSLAAFASEQQDVIDKVVTLAQMQADAYRAIITSLEAELAESKDTVQRQDGLIEELTARLNDYSAWCEVVLVSLIEEQGS